MNAWKVKISAQTILLSIFLTVCGPLHADDQTYEVNVAGYVNSVHGTVQAHCQDGDQVVDGSCGGIYRGISYLSKEIDYPVVTESESHTFTCKPYHLRYDQVALLSVKATCKRAKTAKLAQKI